MKTYEEMARDVLKRRDEELLKVQKTQNHTADNMQPEVVYPASGKRRLLPKIAIPCAAAVLVGAVGAAVWNNIPQGGYIQNIVAERDTEIGPPLAEGPEIVSDNDNQDNAPASAERETKINIVDTSIASTNIPPAIDFPTDDLKFEPYTLEKLNEFYGIEFNRFSRLHTDWNEECGALGIRVRETEGIVTENYAASSSREVADTYNRIDYTTPDGSNIMVTAERFAAISDFGVSKEEHSLLNGYDAVIARVTGAPGADLLYHCSVDMDGTTVHIDVNGLSEQEFIKLILEYTNNSVSDEIFIHDTMPQFFRDVNPFGSVCGNLLDDTDFEPISDINRYYRLEFDRLTRLHSDWNEQHSDFGIYTRTTDDGIAVMHKIVWARNRIYYTLPNTAELYVEAQQGSLPSFDTGTFIDGTVPANKTFSTVNGYSAMIYRSGDSYDDRIFPNGDTRFGAVVEIDNTVVHLSAAGLTEEEFLNVLYEYTEDAANGYDEPEPVAVEPVAEDPTDIDFEAVDPIDDRITYRVKLSSEKTTLGTKRDFDYFYEVEDSKTALGYLREFFGNDLPIDEEYNDNWVRNAYNGDFACNVPANTTAHSPVDGKVISVNYYTFPYGNSVMVEFGSGKVFMLCYLDKVAVNVGDTVTAGQILGVCGTTGSVPVGEPQLSLILMNKK